MDTRTDLVVLRAAEPPVVGQRFDRVSMALHWATVLLIVFQLVTAFLPHEGPGARDLLMLHRSAGVLTLAVVLARLGWCAAFAHAPPLPRRMTVLQRSLARANEYSLYLMLLVQPASGLADGLFHGRPVVLFGLRVPALMPTNKPLFHLSGEVHERGAWLLMVLIGVHVGAAVFHGLVLRDGVVERMLPQRHGNNSPASCKRHIGRLG
jgi:cytochrome b561